MKPEPNPNQAVSIYQCAKKFMETAGYLGELEWQATRSISAVTETEFLEETAWVILCSGFKEATVRRYFDYLSLCFCDWEGAAVMVEKGEQSIHSAFPVFRNKRKLDAIIRVAEIVMASSFERIHRDIQSAPIDTLKQFPFIGDITVWHLAKNLGLQVAKPDRHLVRISETMGYECVQEFCNAISKVTGDAIDVIDLTLWRYAASSGAKFV